MVIPFAAAGSTTRDATSTQTAQRGSEFSTSFVITTTSTSSATRPTSRRGRVTVVGGAVASSDEGTLGTTNAAGAIIHPSRPPKVFEIRSSTSEIRYGHG